METATESRPLTDEERNVLRSLIARESAFATPATRVGEPYEALVNLSVPRRGDSKDRGTDLVMRGETIYLTAEEAAQFNRRDARSGRLIPVVRRITGPDGTREPLPPVLPRMVSGRLFRPVMPDPASGLPRPDPEGSSQVQEVAPVTPAQSGNAPESAGAMSASVEELANQLKSAPDMSGDAVDIPPRNARRARSGG